MYRNQERPHMLIAHTSDHSNECNAEKGKPLTNLLLNHYMSLKVLYAKSLRRDRRKKLPPNPKSLGWILMTSSSSKS